jgi:hypothetical protein
MLVSSWMSTLTHNPIFTFHLFLHHEASSTLQSLKNTNLLFLHDVWFLLNVKKNIRKSLSYLWANHFVCKTTDYFQFYK